MTTPLPPLKNSGHKGPLVGEIFSVDPSALCPYVGCCIRQILIRLFDDIFGPNFFLGCVCVKAFPRKACCCQKMTLLDGVDWGGDAIGDSMS